MPEFETHVDEIADGIFRISTRLPDLMPGGFTMNQFLVRDERPLLFHTGPRFLFETTRRAVARVVAPESLEYVGWSHVEADESGALNEWLALAPRAVPLASGFGAHMFLADSADRPARALTDGERIELGRHRLRWIDAPNLPHGMDAGYFFEETTRTLLCGDLFAQPGADLPALTEGDILEPSEALRQAYPYAPVRNAREMLERLAATEPAVLGCMHGSSFSGNGQKLLLELGARLAG